MAKSFAMVLCLCLCGIALYAQGTSGNITGQVLDPSGLAIPGAQVVATNTATNVATKTISTETGNYNIMVYPGVYRVTAEAGGFKRYLRNDVAVTASGTVRVDAVLEIGSVAESVEVSGSLLSVQSENAKVSTSVENKFVDELPLVVGGTMRNPYNLVQIAAQVTSSGDTEMSMGGGQMRAWNATLDGLGITTNRPAETFEVAYAAPSLEAITEFAVDTNGFKAEYGQAAGGIVTFSSRSGTNDFHGTAYDFLRNQKLDARNFFEQQKGVYKQNDFGAAGGGPVVIPKLYNGRNRTFFYLAYEGFRNRVGSKAVIASIPTPEMYDGDFTNWVDQNNKLLPIYDPATTRPNPSGSGFIRDAFSGNRVPKARFSALSQKIMPYAQGVKPNRGGQPGTIGYVRNNWINSSGTVQSPQNKGSAKIDHVLNDSHRLGFFMNISKYEDSLGADGPPGLPTPLWNGTIILYNIQSYRMTHDWVISSALLNHFQIGGNVFFKDQRTPNAVGGWKSKVCMANVIDCDVNFPNMSFTEFTSWGGTASSGHEQPMWAFKDDFSYNHRKHAFKFGVSYQTQPSTGFGKQNISGQASFSFLGTSVPGDTSFRSGSSFASFLLGDAHSGATETIRDSTMVYPYYGFYAQDDWRLSRRLTLNLGVRWDLSPAPHAVKDWYSDLAPTKPNTAINGYPGALRFAGFGEGTENSHTLVSGWYKGIGPRLGLAYALNDKTTLRTAFGRSFNKVTVTRDSGHYQGFFARYNFSSSDQGITPAFNWDKGLPPYPLPISMDPKAKLDPTIANNDEIHYHLPGNATRSPETLYWTFNLQREVAANTVVEAGYSATIGTHLMGSLVNLNQVPTPVWNAYVEKLGVTAARNLLLSDIRSAAAQAAGVPVPYANFVDPTVQRTRTVNQALRPFPQFLNVVTGVRGNGDHGGHSSYHSLILKATRRYFSGLAMEWNYVFSKILTDTDSQVEGDGTTQDQYNRRLEKSIGEFDQSHAVKLSTVYELPVGKGKRLLGGSGGVANTILGGWRLGAIASYMSGFPIRVTRNNPLPIFNRDTRPAITTYDNWRAPIKGEKFDPAVDRFLDKSVFPTQPTGFGNMTRHNPKARSLPIFEENLSLAKKFSISERFSLDYRWEAFNLLNRVRFSTGGTGLDSTSFGVVTSQTNSPRRMQMGLKLYW
ncbi:MAG: TonB-dependent receptor domain-containing protein [Bryobacteraceae bacterium]